MFEGSQHHDHGYFQPLQGAGATLNGSTNADRTNYWEVVPAERARTRALDGIRSHGIPPAGAHRREVHQPARRGAERAAAELREPPLWAGTDGHAGSPLPARSPVPLDDDWRGGRSRTRHVSNEVHAFFQRYYHPGERVDCARRRLRSRRRRWRSSSSISAKYRPANASIRCKRQPRSSATSASLLEDRVELPRLYLAWLTPAMFAEGDADLDLANDLLANGKTSRLYKRLVFDERIATDVSASQNSREISGYTATRRHRRARAHAWRTRSGDPRGNRTARRQRTERRRDGTRPRAGRSAIHLSAADGRRFRRQVRSVERLQRIHGRSRVTSSRISAATTGSPPNRCVRPSVVT